MGAYSFRTSIEDLTCYQRHVWEPSTTPLGSSPLQVNSGKASYDDLTLGWILNKFVASNQVSEVSPVFQERKQSLGMRSLDFRMVSRVDE